MLGKEDPRGHAICGSFHVLKRTVKEMVEER